MGTGSGILSFLKIKLQGYSVLSLMRLQIEALLLCIFSWVPTLFGFFLRVALGKILFMKSEGFQWIQPMVIFVHTDKIAIGNNVGINSNTYINGVGGIEIGNFVLIGNNVTISSGRHPIKGIFPEVFSRPVEQLKITICDGVWIGAGAVIMPGITLGRGSVIGANSVVTKNTAEYSINVGVPAKMIGTRLDG